MAKRLAHDLFYAMWMPDLFMKRVEADADWSLFCPNELWPSRLLGEEFEQLLRSTNLKGVLAKWSRLVLWLTIWNPRRNWHAVHAVRMP